jgi:hypothetical protein
VMSAVQCTERRCHGPYFNEVAKGLRLAFLDEV